MTLTVQRKDQTLELPFQPRGAVVGVVVPGSPAETGDFRAGDRVVAVDGQSFRVAEEFGEHIRNGGTRELVFTLDRNGETVEAKVTPAIPVGDSSPRIGVQWDSDMGIVYDEFGKFHVVHPGPIEQLRLSMMAIVNTFDALLSRKSDIKLQHMAGPVQIVRIYYILFENEQGWRQALWFSVILNVNLGLLNLLPVPILDGGHIVLAMIEWVRRRPLNARILAYIQYAFASLVIGFMLYVTFFDAQDLITRESEPIMKFEAKPAGK